MRLSFIELAIDMRDYNGRSSQMARALIVNKACDYVMHYLYPHLDEDEVIPHADEAVVNFTLQIVELPVSVHPEFH